jgi:hypothetical protein
MNGALKASNVGTPSRRNNNRSRYQEENSLVTEEEPHEDLESNGGTTKRNVQMPSPVGNKGLQDK